MRPCSRLVAAAFAVGALGAASSGCWWSPSVIRATAWCFTSSDITIVPAVEPAFDSEPHLVVADQPVSLGLKALQLCEHGYGGEPSDLTDQATWAVAASEEEVAHFDAGGVLRVTPPLAFGGPLHVRASVAGANTGYATVWLDLKLPDVVDPGAPPEVATPGDFPVRVQTGGSAIVYPLDDALMPWNLAPPTLQWFAAPDQKVFRIRASGAGIEAVSLLGSGPPTCVAGADRRLRCAHQLDRNRWQTIARTASRDDGASMGQVTLEVAGAASPFEEAVASAIKVGFAAAPAHGDLYYSAAGVLRRVLDGGSGAADVLPRGAAACTGCHAPSADGSRIAATFGGLDGPGGIVDGNDPGKVILPWDGGGGRTPERWNAAAFSPDGQWLLTARGGTLTLRDAGGVRIADVDTGGPALLPAWSPDGSMIAFVQLPPDGKLGADLPGGTPGAGDWVTCNAGAIAVAFWDAGKRQFSAPKVIVPTQKGAVYHHAPSFSPDSRWLAFSTTIQPSTAPPAGFPPDCVISYGQREAHLRLVGVDGNQLTELVNIHTDTDPGGVTWPRFAPFQDGNLAYVTFSSARPYGFLASQPDTLQLWMAAIDLSRAGRYWDDPSFRPFWLPTQDPHTPTYNGVWVAR